MDPKLRYFTNIDGRLLYTLANNDFNNNFEK